MTYGTRPLPSWPSLKPQTKRSCPLLDMYPVRCWSIIRTFGWPPSASPWMPSQRPCRLSTRRKAAILRPMVTKIVTKPQGRKKGDVRKLLNYLAGTTGLEPATSCVTDKPSTFCKLLPFNHFIQNKRLKLCGRMCVAVSSSRQVPRRSLHFPLQYLPLPLGLTGGMEVGNHRRNQGGC